MDGASNLKDDSVMLERRWTGLLMKDTDAHVCSEAGLIKHASEIAFVPGLMCMCVASEIASLPALTYMCVYNVCVHDKHKAIVKLASGVHLCLV